MMATKREIDMIVEQYSDMLFKLALHHVHDYAQAQDIVQDAFMKYLYKAPEFHDREHEKAWLLRITSNLCKDHLKHWWLKKRTDIIYEDMIAGESKETYELLEIVRQLPFHQRNAIYLYYYEDMSVREISEVYHVKESTVSSWLFRARKKLKELLKGEWDYE